MSRRRDRRLRQTLHFIGCELSDHFADLAARRIAAAYEQRQHNADPDQGDLFATA